MATARAEKDEETTEDLTCPSCGKEYPSTTNGPHFFAKHVATCKGPQATSGRIAARDGEARRPDLPRAKKSRKRSAVRRERKAVPVPRPRSRSEKRKPAAQVGHPVSPAQFIAACRAEITKLERAIEAAEALA